MKKLRQILFRIICVFQIILASGLGIMLVLDLFKLGEFILLLQVVAYLFIAWLPIFALSLLNYNYPDNPVAGSQKKLFNRLFLINFLLLSLLFAAFFRDYRVLSSLIQLTGVYKVRLFWSLYGGLILDITMLIFQMVILYGLYHLRVVLARNFDNKKFDFELVNETNR